MPKSVATEGKPPKDRPFNPSLIAVAAESHQLVAEVMRRLLAAETRQRQRVASAREIHGNAVAALVCDLAHRYLMEPDGWLTVELSKGALAPGRRRAPFMTEQFVTLVKSLAYPAVAMAELVLGDQRSFTGVRSTLRASASLRQLVDELGLESEDFSRDPALLGEPLELRSRKVKKLQQGKVKFIAHRLPLPDGETVAQMREQMNEINAWIAQASLGWVGDARTDKVDLDRRFLRRIFNNGSLEAGGRLFGGFWQDANSTLRGDNLLIDEQPTASLDFAQSALRMAYAQAGVEPPAGDLYGVPGLERFRSETKQIINALLSADTLPTRFPQRTRGTMPKSWKFERPYSQIARYHAPIAHQFGSASGLHFMKQESDILIRALLRLRSMDIVALPIHDCVLVAWRHRETAKAVMEESFYETFGVLGVVEVEGSDWMEPRRGMMEAATHGTLRSDEGVLATPDDVAALSLGDAGGMPMEGVVVDHCDGTLLHDGDKPTNPAVYLRLPLSGGRKGQVQEDIK